MGRQHSTLPPLFAISGSPFMSLQRYPSCGSSCAPNLLQAFLGTPRLLLNYRFQMVAYMLPGYVVT